MNGLSIVIVLYRPGKEVLSCLRSISTKITCNHEVILVDNSPTREPVLDQIEKEFPNLQLISIPDNPGFGTANNIGARVARQPNLMFINPDTVLNSNIDNPEHFLADSVGISSGYCIDGNGNYKRTAGKFPIDPRMLFLFSRRLDNRPPLANGNFEHLHEIAVDYTEGSLYLIRSDVFWAAGGFDENIFLYGEDYELSYRVHKAGYRNVIHRDLRYMHIGGFNQSREPYIINGLIYFSEKHLSRIRALAIRVTLLLRTITLLLFHTCMSIVSINHRARVKPLVQSFRRCISS